jgi:hypothetical protein
LVASLEMYHCWLGQMFFQACLAAGKLMDRIWWSASFFWDYHQVSSWRRSIFSSIACLKFLQIFLLSI